MRANQGKNTEPEVLLRSALRSMGLRGYRLHWPSAPGRPDVAFPGRKVAVFVNGCFWHRCPHCGQALPKSHTDFWQRKFQLNQERDQRKRQELEETGWTVLVLWECEVRTSAAACALRVADLVKGSQS